MRPYVFTLLLLFLVAQLSTDIYHYFYYLNSTRWWLLIAAVCVLVDSKISQKIKPYCLSYKKYGLFSITIAAVLVLILLPTGKTQPAPTGLGDSLWLIEIIPAAAYTIGWWTTLDEILEPLIRSVLVRTFADSNSIDSVLFWLGAYSTVCGLFLIISILIFVYRRPVRFQLAAFLLIFFVPSTQLFLNYIEHYSFAALSIAVILLLIWTDIEAQNQNQPSKKKDYMPILIAAFAVIGFLHHGIVGFLLPTLIVYLLKRSKSKNDFILMALKSSAVAMLILVIGWFFYLYVLDESIKTSHLWHLPVLPLNKLFSSSNLSKVLTILLLTTPLSYTFIIEKIILRFKKNDTKLKAKLAKDSISVIITVAIISFLVHLVVWNPMIGLPADWDLLSFVSIPIHIFILRQLSFKKSIRLIPIAMLTLLPAMLWWWSNHQKSKYDIYYSNLTFNHSQAVITKINQSTIFSKIPHQRKQQLLLLRLYSVKLGEETQNLKLAFENAERVAAFGSDSEFDSEITKVKSLLEEASRN
ncbi:MAG: hypothetical protein H3C43_02875 [Leptonema sp. (in: Bacteria)]|nr:hypothetical protein [Leptonema sp. (in: bacteria)]